MGGYCVKKQNNIINQPTKSVSTTERVFATSMSVDDYFDELISQVHEDYAALNDVTGTKH